jgi:hypothetical protein
MNDALVIVMVTLLMKTLCILYVSPIICIIWNKDRIVDDMYFHVAACSPSRDSTNNHGGYDDVAFPHHQYRTLFHHVVQRHIHLSI